MIKIARVFPRKTSMSPTDTDAYFGTPELFMPKYDEVHISVTFTWDIERGHYLKKQWETVCDKVLIGGPAFNDPGKEFVAGMYLKEGMTITSRGCPNKCRFCFVPEREGKIRELPIIRGNIIQDNNLLACSKSHIEKVFSMLRSQKSIDFSGGLESARITDGTVERLRGLSIGQMWLAYDHPNAEKPLIKAVEKLKRYFKRDQLRCYVLIGYEGDTLAKAESRLCRAWGIGTLPFAMRYRTPSNNWDNTFLFKERVWNLFARKWTRPAIIKSLFRKTRANYDSTRTQESFC